MSGPATRRVLEREYSRYGQAAYQRLAGISVAHLYRLRNTEAYRKHIGYGYISAQHAQAMDQFHREHLNPYVNFHRPCAVPTILTAANGKRRRIYQRWATPFELLRELPRGEGFCDPASPAPNWNVSPNCNPTPRPRWPCNAPKRKLFGRFKGIQSA